MPEEQVSAGLIPFYREDSPLQVLLLHYPQGHWGFPKGHKEEEETLWETAVRELDEETGLSDLEKFPDFFYEIEYEFQQDDRLIHKFVVFFAARVNTREVTLSHEHQDYEWLEPEEARERITYQNEINTLERWLEKFHRSSSDSP